MAAAGRCSQILQPWGLQFSAPDLTRHSIPLNFESVTSEISGQPLFVLSDNLRKVISLWPQKKASARLTSGRMRGVKQRASAAANRTPRLIATARPSICARNGWIFDTLAFPTLEERKSENVMENERRFSLRRPTFPSEIAVMPS